jgi:hypothetical protein
MSENGFFRGCLSAEREGKIHFVFYWCSGIWAAATAPWAAAAPWAACGSPPLRGGSLGGVQLPSPVRQRAAPIPASPGPWAVCAQQAVAGSRPAGKQRCRAVVASSGQATAAGDSWLPAAAGKAKEWPADRDPESKLLRAAALLLHP